MKRRNFLMISAAAVAGAWWLRPDDRGNPHDDYFSGLQNQLRLAGIGKPVLVIDQARMRRNCDRLKALVGPHRDYRIVAKSLPSLAMVEDVMARTDSHRVMGFHQPFLNTLANRQPHCDLLLGKPMPVQAAENFYEALNSDTGFDPARQLQWLIDSEERLQQYLQLAVQKNLKLAINIEVDVGLHRGGLRDPEGLDAIMATIAMHPDHLHFSGLMGYDAHVGKLPGFVESKQTSLEKSNSRYRAFMARIQNKHSHFWRDDLVLNGAGSPTVALHDDASPLRELSAGSCLVKPADFDLPELADFEPAAFIATPVLKVLDGLQLPGPLPVGEVWAAWDVNRRRSYFIYGGNWLAKPASPAGLADNAVYGTSSNQMLYNGSPRQALRTDDFMFFRPTQSEAVLLQFGNLAVRDEHGGLQWWAPFSEGRHST